VLNSDAKRPRSAGKEAELGNTIARAKHHYCLLKFSGQPTKRPPASYPQHRKTSPFPTSATPNPGPTAAPYVGCLPRFGVACLPSNWSGLSHPLRSASSPCSHWSPYKAIMSAALSRPRSQSSTVPSFHRQSVRSVVVCDLPRFSTDESVSATAPLFRGPGDEPSVREMAAPSESQTVEVTTPEGFTEVPVRGRVEVQSLNCKPFWYQPCACTGRKLRYQ
jgi:hypothetical protein